MNSLYRQLPAIDRLLHDPELQDTIAHHGSYAVSQLLRQMQAEARSTIRQHQCLPEWQPCWLAEVRARLTQRQRSALQPVFNLSGTVLHTNLGRALLAENAIDALCQSARQAVTLEYALDEAERGHRDRALAQLLCELTGAEDACIVNNNAAAVWLMLAALAPGKEVIVSRGELVEIGGAFRIPDIMCQAGCLLREVGTTNRTHLHDYRDAINDNSALLMKVHTSNYHIQGFTAAVDEASLVALAGKYSLPVIADLGSGSLLDLSQYGLPAEPMPQRLIAAGVSLVSFSGDKLLGGPQAGIIVGKKALIGRLQRHPLKRALRIDKLTLAALEATLKLYRQPEKLLTQLPTLRLLTRSQDAIRQQAERLLPLLHKRWGAEYHLQTEPCWSQTGSGALPQSGLPSYAITFAAREEQAGSPETLAQQWRQLPVPVIGCLRHHRLWLDLRCLEDEALLIRMLTE